jgi:hypothetical protein
LTALQKAGMAVLINQCCHGRSQLENQSDDAFHSPFGGQIAITLFEALDATLMSSSRRFLFALLVI